MNKLFELFKREESIPVDNNKNDSVELVGIFYLPKRIANDLSIEQVQNKHI